MADRSHVEHTSGRAAAHVLVIGPDGQRESVIASLTTLPLVEVVDDHRDAHVIVLVDPADEHWALARAQPRPIVYHTAAALGADAMLTAVMRGADAVIDAGSEPDEVTRAISTVMNGGVVLSAAFTRRLAEALRTAATEGSPTVLSRRERQILENISLGHSVKQTADELGITAKTVENLQTRLYKKLGVRNRYQALALARALGLIH